MHFVLWNSLLGSLSFNFMIQYNLRYWDRAFNIDQYYNLRQCRSYKHIRTRTLIWQHVQQHTIYTHTHTQVEVKVDDLYNVRRPSSLSLSLSLSFLFLSVGQLARKGWTWSSGTIAIFSLRMIIGRLTVAVMKQAEHDRPTPHTHTHTNYKKKRLRLSEREKRIHLPPPRRSIRFWTDLNDRLYVVAHLVDRSLSYSTERRVAQTATININILADNFGLFPFSLIVSRLKMMRAPCAMEWCIRFFLDLDLVLVYVCACLYVLW